MEELARGGEGLVTGVEPLGLVGRTLKVTHAHPLLYLRWKALQRECGLQSPRLSVFLHSNQSELPCSVQREERLFIQFGLSGAGSEQWEEKDNFPVGGGASGQEA